MGGRPPTEIDTTIAKNIRARRTEVGMSQSLLAERVGVAEPAWSLIERGRRRITASQLVDVARVLGTTLETLYAGLDVFGGQSPPVDEEWDPRAIGKTAAGRKLLAHLKLLREPEISALVDLLQAFRQPQSERRARKTPPLSVAAE